ncbi:single-stranded DNA-binding protein [Limnobacter sp.]|uniref:single-stranded DNA-binding protein n=1 Tax=Limnobacter sp. TaxID=2003368 RepID=UPI00311DF5D0
MAILTGLFRLTRDCELRYLPSGEPVANLVLAYNYGSKRKDDGFFPSQFLEAGLWGKRAESLEEHLKKGTKLFLVIEDVHNETFEKSDQSKGFKLTGRIGALEFVGGGENSQDESKPSGRPTNSRGRKAQQSVANMDDDIPFD